MAVNLLTPILSTRTRSVNFFNGRLLAGEDLTTEQQSNRVAHALLGRATGDGVVCGLEVNESLGGSTPLAPVLSVTSGVAINKNGGALLLDSNTDIALVRPDNGSDAAVSNTFEDCTPAQAGPYIAGAGAFVLAIGPANAAQGLAEVSGTNPAQVLCNSKYNAQGVQFRIVPIDPKLLGLANLDDVAHLRNQLAYGCFGVADWSTWRARPFDLSGNSFGVLDSLRSSQLLTNCDVPLAVLFWTADGLQFIDTWAARRRVVTPSSTSDWPLLVGDRRLAEGEAMFLQFQDQLSDIRTRESDLPAIAAGDRFMYLPPVGILPSTGLAGAPGFTYQTFFGGQSYHKPVYVEAALIQPIVRTALKYDPVNLANGEAVRIFEVVDRGQSLPYVIFTSIYVPFEGEARFDVSAWDFSNFSLT